MIPRTRPSAFPQALRSVRAGRLAALLFAAVAAGLAADWLRGEARLIFPRPLPVFTTTLPAR
ncbi:MAG: hypothetical protein EXS40_06485 [Opitutaceae bacterium]|nr:hypothetical protein [Opitutaceae bacterium]